MIKLYAELVTLLPDIDKQKRLVEAYEEYHSRGGVMSVSGSGRRTKVSVQGVRWQVCVCARVCVRVCVRACVCVCAHVYVCVHCGQGRVCSVSTHPSPHVRPASACAIVC